MNACPKCSSPFLRLVGYPQHNAPGGVMVTLACDCGWDRSADDFKGNPEATLAAHRASVKEKQ